MSGKPGRMVLALAFCLVAGRAFGEDGPASTAPVQPKADEGLRQMSKHLAGVRQFSFQVYDMVDELLDSGQKIQLSSTRRIAVRRPDRVSAETVGDLLNERVRYDGSTLTVLDIQQNVYSAIQVPDNIDEALDYVAQRYGLTMPLADLLVSDPYEDVIGGVQFGQYIGLHDVQGVKCHHLAFRQEGLDWQIWVEDGARPLPRKLVITYKAAPGQPQYVAFLGEWNLSPQLPDSAFTLEIPEGVERIDLEAIATQATPVRTPGEEPAPSDRDGG